MIKATRFLLYVLIIATLLLSACGGAATPNVGGGKAEPIPVAFTGIVNSIAGDQWVINSQAVTVDPTVVRDGPFSVGDHVKVEGVVNPDGSFIVSRVGVPTSEDLSTLPQFGDNSNANSNDVNANDDNGNDVNANDANANDENSNSANSNDDNGNSANSNDGISNDDNGNNNSNDANVNDGNGNDNSNDGNVNDDNSNDTDSNDDNSNSANSNDDSSNTGGNDNGGANENDSNSNGG